MDSYIEIRTFKNKKDAYNYEKGIIDFMTFFLTDVSLNSSNNLVEFLKINKC